MQLSTVLGTAVLAAVASASNSTVTSNVVVTDFTTYCPEPTHFVVNNKTVSVTEETTITITGECTIPTTYTTETSTVASTTPDVQTENGAGKVAVGAVAGIAAVGAALF